MSFWMFSLALALAAYALYRAFSKQFIKAILFFFLSFSLFSLTLAFQGFMRVANDEPLVKVVIPGISRESGYLVRIESLSGDLLAEHTLHGDLVGMRTKIVRVKSFFAILGLSNLCKIEMLHSGYMSIRKMRSQPHEYEELSLTHQKMLSPLFEKLWERIFFEKASFFWIKSAVLQSTYFPLVDKKGQPYQGAFLLTLNAAGVSSLALSDENSLK